MRQRLQQRRAGWQWYLFILLGIPALILFGIVIQPGTLASFQGLTPLLIDTPQLVWIPLFLAVDETKLNLALLIPFGVLALLIVIFTHGRLGYDPSQPTALAGGQIEAQTISSSLPSHDEPGTK